MSACVCLWLCLRPARPSQSPHLAGPTYNCKEDHLLHYLALLYVCTYVGVILTHAPLGVVIAVQCTQTLLMLQAAKLRHGRQIAEERGKYEELYWILQQVDNQLLAHRQAADELQSQLAQVQLLCESLLRPLTDFACVEQHDA